ncbi:hypothetical protein D9M68_415360 [compost metagenome]
MDFLSTTCSTAIFSLKYVVLLLVLLCSMPFGLHANIGRGCYVGGVLYTQNTAKGNRYFYRSPGNLTSDCGFQPVGNNANCRLYNSGNINNNSSYTLYSGAFSNKWEEIICPIDENVWMLVCSAAGIGFLLLKSDRKYINAV